MDNNKVSNNTNSNVATDGQNKKEDVRFNSAEIPKKTEPDFFAGRIKDNKKLAKNLNKFFPEGKRKFITIALAIAILATVIITLWLTVWNQGSADIQKPADTKPWSQQLNDITNETYEILNSGSDSAFMDALSFIDNKIEATTNSDHKFELRITKATFLNLNGGAQWAIDDLLTIDVGSLTDRQRYHLYLSLAAAYRQIGDETSAKVYDGKIDELPESVTNIGG